jgi:hypothetical protein
MFISKIFPIFLVFLLAGCWNEASQIDNQTQQFTNIIQEGSDNQNQQIAEPELTLIMERYTWTHTLDYKIEIQSDGKVNFTKTNGRLINTKVTGKAESKLEEEKMKQLLSEIENADFFSLESAYGYRYKNCASALSDNDSVKLHIKLNGQEKTINHDLGCFDVSYAELYREINRKDRIFPQKLYKLENKIDEIVETKRWIGERK